MKMLSMSFAVASVLVAVSACTKVSGNPSSDNSSFAAKATHLAGANAVTSCSGTQPFWSLKIGKEKIEFASLGNEVTMSMSNSGAKSSLGSTSEYISLYQGKTLENDVKYMNVIVERSECSDHMSDNTYPYTVHVLSGSSLYTGCCR